MRGSWVPLFIGLCWIPIPSFGQDSLGLLNGWRFKPDPGDLGFKQAWYAPYFQDDDWAVIDAGLRWEDQGFSDLDGTAWYRKRFDVPKDWEGQAVWFLLGGANDSYILYCNGQEVARFGDRPDPGSIRKMNASEQTTVAQIATMADLAPFLQYGVENSIALSFHDWGGSGGPWREPCLLTTDVDSLPRIPQVHQYPSERLGGFVVEIDGKGLGQDFSASNIEVQIESDSTSVSPMSLKREGKGVWVALFDPKELPKDGAGVIRVVPKGWVSFPPVVIPLRSQREREWPEPYDNLKVLNNCVTELYDSSLPHSEWVRETIKNPRKGWVLVSISPEDPGEEWGQLLARWVGTSRLIIWRRNPDNGNFESIMELDEGEHRIEIEHMYRKGRLSIRRIPELAYSYYPCTSHLAPHGDYDWKYLTQYVLPHVTTLITHGDIDEAIKKEWLNEGRLWVGNASLPGLSGPPPNATEVYEYWSKNIGIQSPDFGGLIVDEFIGASSHHYAAWLEALKMLRNEGLLEDKIFYAWCGDLYQQKDESTQAFVQDLIDHGDRFALEKYLAEEATEEEAIRALNRSLHRSHLNWTENYPDFAHHLILCLGYLSAPPESLNTNPAVDYRVFLDMQFHHLATTPVYWGIDGIMEYTTSYADEEMVRWAHQLFRHYCIEGNTNRLTEDPYDLPHLKNPDFDQGLNHWTVQEAASGTITASSQEGFSWLQGRYPETERGNTYCEMTRAEKPNRISQKLKELKPGRLYSVKLITADINDWDKNQEIELGLDLENGEWIDEYTFKASYPSNYAHEFGPYDRNHPAYFTYYRYVFRASGQEDVLAISDQPSQAERIAFNFVEVQPFFEPVN
ncbi:MAG: hypothetical protein H6752_16830 [Candidatus Omnitrophica bacterium]|nr:hypothetical protein [Candidatus Omnitrophota bacterium]